VAPLPPAPPAPPAFDHDFNFDFDFDFDFDPGPNFPWKGDTFDWKIDKDAIRESARAAAESAREAAQAFAYNFGAQGPSPRPSPNPFGRSPESRADSLYRQARESIDHARYDRAIQQLDQLIGLAATRVDAALYWKSYSLAKQGQRDQALTTLADLQKRFADSRWMKDAKALEVEVRQASGQAVSPDAQNDEEIKLLALRGLMQGDPDRVVPMIEKLLAGNSSVKMQENALFVLGQSRSPKAREILAGVARNGNPDLQLRAVRYLGAAGGTENRQVLDEVYRASNDTAVKRAILRGFMTSGDRARLLSVAKTENSAELRAAAIQQLGAMNATAELSELYQSETSPEVKRRIIQGLAASGGFEKLSDLARSEKDLDLRRAAIRSLGQVATDKTSDAVKTGALKTMYAADTSLEVRRDILNAIAAQGHAATLVELARAEKDPTLKREIVQRLANLKSKEAEDYLLELVK